MKLRNLNGAVRKAADKITITMGAPDGRQMYFKVPRSAVVEGLTEAWSKDGMAETGLMVSDDGVLIHDFVETPNPWDAVLPDAADEDLDLFLETAVVRDVPAYDDDDLLV